MYLGKYYIINIGFISKTLKFESFHLSEFVKLRFYWLTKKVICTWPTMGCCQMFIQ